jgi:putative ABC transport system permease protein
MQLSAMDSEWVFLRGMVKPVAALAVPAVVVFLSFHQKLGLEREIPYSIARAFLQLSVIGFVLQFILQQQNVGWIFLAYLFMVRSFLCLSSILFLHGGIHGCSV